MEDTEKGIYEKYIVIRRNDTAKKHADCAYFVLDLNHDKFAIPALAAYAKACEGEYPLLAFDILQFLESKDAYKDFVREKP